MDQNLERDNALYKYPNSDVLRNRFDLRDQSELDRAERLSTRVRIEQGAPNGNFSIEHLQAIHKHLFQDIYPWAGELRQTSISKGNSLFMPPERIEFAMQDVYQRLKAQDFLKGASQEEFAAQAGVIIGDINHIHPFREGNGRTQLQYLKKLSHHAGLQISLNKLDKQSWINASVESHNGNYKPMQACIKAITLPRIRSQQRSNAKDTGRER